MSYFTAVIARDARGWRARDVDVEDAATLDELADILRGAAHRDGPVLAVVEREDEWFALVRVDGDEDPRVFVSDMPAASRSAFADVLAPAADVDVPPVGDAVASGEDAVDQPESAGPAGPAGPAGSAGSAEDDVPLDLADEPATGEEPPPVELDPWAGEPGLLEDLGVSAEHLCELVEEHPDDPAGVLAELGECCGFGELLDALR